MQLMGFVARLRATYWFVPTVLTALAIALAATLISVDAHYPGLTGGVGWLYGGGADGARSLLSAVAGSMMTVVSVTFSVTIVAFTVSSQHFGPRLLNSFMRDTAAQMVLGIFIGTFAYCVVVLRTVQGASEGGGAFVPHLSVTAGVALTLLSVAMLIFYVHHVSTTLQVSEITRRVAEDLESALQRMYPQRIGGAEQAGRSPEVPDGAAAVSAPVSGYVQQVDAEGVLEWACDRDAVVWIAARPGDFVIEGFPLAFTSARIDDTSRDSLANCFVLGTDRTPLQDAAFAVQQLVEVALHALSPGINEPFTAMTCIDRLGQGLAQLAQRRIPAAGRTDREGRLRVVAHARTFADLLHGAFAPLRAPSASSAAVTERLLHTLGLLAARASRHEDLQAIREEIDAVHQVTVQQWGEPTTRDLDTASAAALGAVARSLERQASGRHDA